MNKETSSTNLYQPDESDSAGKAIPLITIVNKKFVISQEAQDLLNDEKFKAVGVISLVGKYRTGKSFLLNRVLLNNSSFNSKKVILPETLNSDDLYPCFYSKPSEDLIFQTNHIFSSLFQLL